MLALMLKINSIITRDTTPVIEWILKAGGVVAGKSYVWIDENVWADASTWKD